MCLLTDKTIDGETPVVHGARIVLASQSDSWTSEPGDDVGEGGGDAELIDVKPRT